MYTNATLYLVDNPVNNGPVVAGLNLFVGLLSIWLNYIIDEQRQHVRATGGKCTLGFGPDWGQPPRIMLGHYTTTDGKQRVSELLINGWWGVSRHVHYLPELAAALSWCACAGGVMRVTPVAYVVFLAILLADRAVRDEHRMRAKYGEDYKELCRLVPHYVVPGVF